MKKNAPKDGGVLILSGGYEFVQEQAPKSPSKKRLEFLAKAYESLRCDLVFVTPEERAHMVKAGVRPHASWRGSEKVEEHLLTGPGGVKIGVALLPPVPVNERFLPERMVHLVENAVANLQAKAKLVVVMSPWGYQKEQQLLEKANRRLLPDVLLGSGPGIGMVGELAAGGRTAWIRAFSQGKAVHGIDILAWPEHNSTFKWTEQQNIRMSLFGLTDQYQDDPQMLRLMQQMGTD